MENIGYRPRNNSDQASLALSDDPIARALELSHQKAAHSFKTQTNDPTIPSSYTLRSKGKSLQFVGVNHVDNLKRMAQEDTTFIEEANRRCRLTFDNIMGAISQAPLATSSIIIEGMPRLDPDQEKPDRFFDALLKKYPEMDWENPNIEQFLSFENASEMDFAALIAHRRGMRIISSESQRKQIAALCKGKSESYVSHAFMFFACRDLVRYRGHGDGNDQAKNGERGVMNEIERLNKCPEFQSLTMDSIHEIARPIWGSGALGNQAMADEMAHLITPYPMQYIKALDALSAQKKDQLKLFNQIAQDLSKIRDRAIIDLAIHEFKSHSTVIPIFGSGHGQSCHLAFQYLMGSKGQAPLF